MERELGIQILKAKALVAIALPLPLIVSLVLCSAPTIVSAQEASERAVDALFDQTSPKTSGNVASDPQEPIKPQVKADVPADQSVVDLVIFVRVSGNRYRSNVRQMFKDAVAVTDACSCSDVIVEPISTAEYEMMKVFIESPELFTFGSDFVPPIEQHEDGSNDWIVHRANPYDQVNSIVVRYSADGQNQEETFPLVDADDETGRFRADTSAPGRFRFSASENWDLREYRLEVQGVPASTFSDWPPKSRKFSVRLTDFRGAEFGRQALLNALREQLPNQFLIEGVKQGDFSFANFRNVISGPQPGWTGNIFSLEIPRLGGRREQQAEKIWVIFPLTESKMRELKQRLEMGPDPNTPNEKFTDETLAKALEAGGLLVTSRNSQNTTLEPTPEPVAFEIKPAFDEGGRPLNYARTFQVEGITDWAERFDGERAYALTIYQGSLWKNGVPLPGEERIIRVNDDMWQTHEIPEWPTGLRENLLR